MIVAFEGLMRVGKTSTIHWIQSSNDKIAVIPETLSKSLVENQCKQMNIKHDCFYVRSDWIKSRLLSQYSSFRWILIDRYFLSTVAYHLCDQKEEADINQLYKTLEWFKGIKFPNVWVFINEDPEVSWKRSLNQTRGNIDGRWKELEFVIKMNDIYHRLFEVMTEIFPRVDVISVHSNALHSNKNELFKELERRELLCGRG